VPLAWGELLEGLKSGLVDATESYSSAAAGFGMYSVLSQDIALEFSPGFSLIFISSRSFQKLPSRIQEIMLEASWQVMQDSYDKAEAAEDTLVGNGSNPSPDSAYVKGNVKYIKLSADERNVFVDKGSIEGNASLYAPLRKQMDDIAGFDVYGSL